MLNDSHARLGAPLLTPKSAVGESVGHWGQACYRTTPAEPFARPGVELCRNAIAVVLREPGHALFLGQVLANERVGAAFPRVVGCSEVKAGAGRLLDR